MLPLAFPKPDDGPLRVLCLGAHSDDIEIGCGATVLRLLEEQADVHVHWQVFSANGDRAREARASARQFLRKAAEAEVMLGEFQDGFFPFDGAAVKAHFETLKKAVDPHVIFTHYRHDRHQDHRLVSDLTWNTWRNHLILEYEIPKYDGDLGRPNVFVPVKPKHVKRKIDLLHKHFPTQAGKQWFDEETFRGLLRLRGLEANSPTRYAEAFHAWKLTL